MAHQIKLKMWAQERYDLPDFNSIQTYISQDFERLHRGLITGDETYIAKGFAVAHASPSLDFNIIVDGSVVFQGGNTGAMYIGEAGTAAIPCSAVSNTTTYFWFEITNLDTTLAARTFWDPAMYEGLGGEFEKNVLTRNELVLEMGSNTSGFPVGANVIPICTTLANALPAPAADILSFTDCRPMLWRLGSGGSVPDVDYVYPWAAGRTEPGVSGAAAIFASGDKQLGSLKECLAAIQSNIKEMKFGTATGAGAVWYAPSPSSLSDGEVSMVDGGTFSWVLGTNTLAWTATIIFLMPGAANTNTIVAGNTTLLDANGKVLYVDLDRAGPFNPPIQVCLASAYVDQPDRYIITRRENDAVFIGIQ